MPAMCTHMCTQKRSAAVGRIRPLQEHNSFCDNNLQQPIVPLRAPPEVHLLPDAKTAEDHAQQIVGAELASADNDPSRLTVLLRADRRGNCRVVNEIVAALVRLDIARVRLAVESSP